MSSLYGIFEDLVSRTDEGFVIWYRAASAKGAQFSLGPNQSLENDGGGQSDSGEKGGCATVAAGGNSLPARDLAEHFLDTVSFLVAALVENVSAKVGHGSGVIISLRAA
ncbi:hypothetical protein E2L05_10885 [Meridianimarinicoccus aquatilis]|uniref:Uncharacterized protein n=1 Tax=Meridianimarinicoccus aquatilis TaxID=2552766 RepID=A0A4R6AZH1_9RHOB|nr:hypothetical protein E2L05_10885 [Fluviibacterium aquatile]